MGLWNKILTAIFGPETLPETFYLGKPKKTTELGQDKFDNLVVRNTEPCVVCHDPECEYDYTAEVEKIRAETLQFQCVSNEPPPTPVADYRTSEDSTRIRAYQLWERDKNAGYSDRGDWYYWFQAKSSS